MAPLFDMTPPLSIGDLLLRMALACVLGACVGWDRESQHKVAGLRTHMLVSLGSAMFTLTALQMFQLTLSNGGDHGDPTRLLQGLVSGIGFLGAGQIIQSRGSVLGVTTAAGIWVVGGVGVACGGGSFVLAVLGAAFVVAILRGMRYVEARFAGGDAAAIDPRMSQPHSRQ